jgi:hypothetical protein
MIHVNPSKVATRRACNRCHQAKLKCILDSSRRCQRCKQSNSDCTFSPPTRIQRQQMRSRSPTSTAVNPAEHQFDSWLNVDFDWGDNPPEPFRLAVGASGTKVVANDEGFAAALHPTPLQYSDNGAFMGDSTCYTADQSGLPSALNLFETSASIIAAAPTGAATSDVSGHNASGFLGLPNNAFDTAGRHAITTYANSSADESRKNELDKPLADLAFWADKIMTLFVGLTQHLQALPSGNFDSTHHDHSNDELQPPSRLHNPGRTFELSESLINVLSGMCLKLPPTGACAATGEGHSTKSLILDEPSYLLLFSTYLRFLEVHDAVFRYLLACLSHKHESSAAGSCFYLPDLILGSFSLAMTSKTRPLLFVNLMESMLGRAKPLFHRLASSKTSSAASDNSCGPFAGLSSVMEPSVALQSIQAREASIVRLVNNIKTMLLEPKSSKT